MRENVSHAMLMYLVSNNKAVSNRLHNRTHSHSLVSSLFLPRRTLKALSLASSQRNSLSRSHFCTHATYTLSLSHSIGSCRRQRLTTLAATRAQLLADRIRELLPIGQLGDAGRLEAL